MNFLNTDVYVWGSNRHHQLGDPSVGDDTVEAPTLNRTLNDKRVTRVACSAQCSYGLTESGTVYVWGVNNFGELGLGNTTPAFTPRSNKNFPDADKVVKIKAGQYSFFAITESGELYYCGLTGFPTPSYKPLPFSELFPDPYTRFHDVAFAVHYGVGLTTQFQLFTWGYFNDRQLQPTLHHFFVGKKTLQVCAVPQSTLPTNPNSGTTMFIALTDDGSVYVWSPVTNAMYTTTPTPIPSLPHIAKIQARSLENDHLLSLSERGDLYMFSLTKKKTQLVEGLSGKKMEHLAVGGTHCLAVDEVGACHVFGVDDVRPVIPDALHGKTVRHAAAGSRHFIVVVDDYQDTVPADTLADDLLRMVTSEKFSDMTIKVESSHLPAHKCILMARCPVLADPRTMIDDCSIKVFVQLLRYLYADKPQFELLSIFDLVQLLHMADRFHLTRLYHQTTRVIEATLKEENVFQALQWVHKRKLKEAKRICMEYILNHNIIAATSKDDVKGADPDLVVDVLQAQANKTILDELPRLAGEEPASTLRHDFTKLWEGSLLTDVTIRLHDVAEGIPAHKVILAARSNLFDTQLRDTTDVFQVPADIQCDRQSYRQFLRYLYCDALEFDLNHAVYMDGFDRYFMLSNARLQVTINYAVLRQLGHANCIPVLAAAAKLGKQDLKQVVIDMICRAWEHVVHLPELEDLPKNILVELMRAKADFLVKDDK
eukprot:TRINITY_DN60183_c0_g1_i1.p1 TRINITY_DN60183_c0_g1~~TRINITY_DN60183_c0_g1_i1.p1  ORF type:complete len:722 (-),score=45.18 TRINITY_DN60183_c0_g1_i1:103-2235(-)